MRQTEDTEFSRGNNRDFNVLVGIFLYLMVNSFLFLPCFSVVVSFFCFRLPITVTNTQDKISLKERKAYFGSWIFRVVRPQMIDPDSLGMWWLSLSRST